MPDISVDQAIQIAQQRAAGGRVAEAEALLRQVLDVQPGHVEALYSLGILALQSGRASLAIEMIGRAIAGNPAISEYHANLGNALCAAGRFGEGADAFRQALRLTPAAGVANQLGLALAECGRMDEAAEAFGQAVRIKADFADGWNNLGSALRAVGQGERAIEAYRNAIRIKPDLPLAHYNLGIALGESGRFDEAIASYQNALRLKPDDPAAYNNLATALRSAQRLDESLEAYRHAIRLKPDYAEAHYNLGISLREQGRLDEAIDFFRRALALKAHYPAAQLNLGLTLTQARRLDEAIEALRTVTGSPEAHFNLGLALAEEGDLDRAIACYRTALRLKPDFADAHNNLGAALREQGLLDEALACFDRAVALKPDDARFHSNCIASLHFHPAFDAQALLRAHREWNQRHATPLKNHFEAHANSPDPQRRLRVGFVSPDFREHPVGRFLLPLFNHHDLRSCEIFCYSDVRVPDAMTERLRSRAAHWRDIVDLDDERVAQLIRDDAIDILVDLAMHADGNRLLVFARKPAPVQVTWLAYCSTTGMDAIDYRLTDPYLDPPGAGDDCYSEQSYRLPETWWCYEPGMPTPDVGPPPMLAGKPVTFGCLNNFTKVSADALAAFADVMAGTPDSRLLLHAREGCHRQRVVDEFQIKGVGPDRLRFIGRVPAADYFRLYGEIDIALDPFPCAGGTTTCDALWMGVPVITLAGRTAVGRAGVSILSNTGLPELVAKSVDEYINLAIRLAADPQRLACLRAELRGRMLQSPLMNAPPFARNIEAAYREMWRRWCSSQ